MARMTDIFASDAFSTVTLTQRILSMPFRDGQLRSRLPWRVTNSTTPDIAVQKNSQGIGVIGFKERGEPGTEFGRLKATIMKFTPPHAPVGATIQATELRAALANVDDAAGQLLTLQALHDVYMRSFNDSYAQLWEYGAGAAIEGLINDPLTGDEVLNLSQIYGEAPQELPVDFTDPNFDWIGAFSEGKTEAISQLGGLPPVQEWIVFMFGKAGKAMTGNKALLATKDRIQDSVHSADRVRGFSNVRYADDVELATYQGTANAPTAIQYDPAEGCAIMLPIVDGMYDVTFTPADTFDAINGPAQEIYVSAPPSKQTETSYRLQAESNFVHTIKKPKGIIKFVQG
jgi:hypothetical protein